MTVPETKPVLGLLRFDLPNQEPLEVRVIFRRDRTMITYARHRWLFTWWRDLENKVHVRSAQVSHGPTVDLCIYNE